MSSSVCPYGWSKNEQFVRCAVASAIVNGMATQVPEHMRKTLVGKMAADLVPLVDHVTVSLRNPNMPQKAWQRIHRALSLASKRLSYDTEWPPEEQEKYWMMQVSVGELLWMEAVILCPMWFSHPASVAVAAGVVKAILKSMTDRLFDGLEEGPVDLEASDAYHAMEKLLGRKL